MGLVGGQARPGDVKHIISVDLAASPEPGPGEPDPFVCVSPDLLTMGEAVSVAHGLVAPGEVEDSQWWSAHGRSLTHEIAYCRDSVAITTLDNEIHCH